MKLTGSALIERGHDARGAISVPAAHQGFLVIGAQGAFPTLRELAQVRRHTWSAASLWGGDNRI